MHLNRPPVWSVSSAQVRPKWARLYAKAVMAVVHDGSPTVPNVVSRKLGTIVGAVARRIIPYVGYGQDTAGGSKNGLNWPIDKIAYPKITLAAIVQFDSFSTTSVIVATDDANSGGIRLQTGATGEIMFGMSGVAVVSTGVILAANKPYFIAVSNDEKRDQLVCVARDLSSDAIVSSVTSNASNSIAGTSGLMPFGYGRDVTESVDGVIAMGFITADAMPLNVLRDWALDPWGPFRYWDEAKVVYAKAGAPAGDGVGSATGTSTVTGVGASTAASVGSAAGTSTASAVGQAAGGGTGVGNASGTSTVSGIGAATAAAAGSAAGTSTATGITPTIAQGVGSASGSSTASGISANQSGVFGGVPFFHSEYANTYRRKKAEEKDTTPAIVEPESAVEQAEEVEVAVEQIAAPSALSIAKAKVKRELQAELNRQEAAYQKLQAKQLEEQFQRQAEEQRNAQMIQELQALIQMDLEEQDEEEAMLLLM